MKRNDIVIAIPSYKLRHTGLIDALTNDIDLYKDKFDIILFTQSNDDNKDLYNKYKTDYIDVIEINATNIAEKRLGTLNKCIEMGYNKMFQLDDDLKYGGKMIDETTKRATSFSYKKKDIQFSTLLYTLLEKMNEYDAAMASFKIPIYLFAGHPGRINKNKSLNAGQFILLDLDKIKENNITYRWTDNKCIEDACIMIDTLMKGLDAITIDYMSYETYNDNSSGANIKTSTIFNDKYDRYKLILYTSYRYKIPIKIDKRDVIHLNIRWEKYYNIETLPELKNKKDIEIYNMIKDYIEKNNNVDENIINEVINKLKYYRNEKK